MLSPVALAACGGDEDSSSSGDGSLEVSGDYCTDIDAVKDLFATAEQADPLSSPLRSTPSTRSPTSRTEDGGQEHPVACAGGL